MISHRFIALPLFLMLILTASAARATTFTHGSLSYDLTFSGNFITNFGDATILTADIAVHDLNTSDNISPTSVNITLNWGDGSPNSVFTTTNLSDTHAFSHVYAAQHPGYILSGTILELARSTVPLVPGPFSCAQTPSICVIQNSDSFDPGYVTVFAIPVPEPETYAMMLAGLGLLAGVARRRTSAA